MMYLPISRSARQRCCIQQYGERFVEILTDFELALLDFVFISCLCFVSVFMVQMSRDPGAELWLADIQEGVSLANQDSQKALKSECIVKLYI